LKYSSNRSSNILKKRVWKLKAVSLSRDATPTINSFVTGGDDIHVDSIREVTKFGKDIKTGR
jgi:hypothetical protein